MKNLFLVLVLGILFASCKQGPTIQLDESRITVEVQNQLEQADSTAIYFTQDKYDDEVVYILLENGEVQVAYLKREDQYVGGKFIVVYSFLVSVMCFILLLALISRD